jgi:AmmeMemoRadiSam system radical SAM enzyme/AmmeMemoRadiSam system protein B/AmmeMemoRadiSam system protein A
MASVESGPGAGELQRATAWPHGQREADGAMPGAWWAAVPGEDRIECLLCPRHCRLKPGDRGFCFVRENRAGQMVLSTYGRSTGFVIDPIEKKPLNHFYPGTAVLSFGTAGCNLGCKFCQNWDISKSRETERLSALAEPDAIARAARELGCQSVAFTYNDPVIWAEYAIDAAKACHAAGVKTVAVTAGYISPAAREAFFEPIDAANVDLKAFSETFYHKVTYSHLQPVLDTLVYLRRHTAVWFEITNLVIPDANDAPDELERMCDWLLKELGDDVPLHFTAFHPDFRMRDRGPTPPDTLFAAYETARRAGLKFVYVGNLHDPHRQSTHCPGCGGLLIERDWYQLGRYNLQHDRCSRCQTQIAGRFATEPGTWGPKRQAVRIGDFALPSRTAPAAPTSPLVALSVSPNSKASLMSTTRPTSPSVTAATRGSGLPALDPQQQSRIHTAACQWVTQAVRQEPLTPTAEALGDVAESGVHGAFVTLKRGSQLRGCCGVLGKPMSLGEATQQAAQRTAIDDQRLAAISPTELPFLEVDVTLLGPMLPVPGEGAARASAIEIGRHGLVIQSGQHSGLLLPTVPLEYDWNVEQFLQAVCRKASLPVDAWKREDVALVAFEGLPIQAPMVDQQWNEKDLARPLPLTTDQLNEYVQLAARNVALLAQGATPSYYAPELPDMTVHAIVISMQWGDENQMQQGNAIQVSVRPGVPLQSTLFQMCESIANIFARQRYTGRFNLGLTVGVDPALHGMGEEEHLEGLDTARRGIIINDPRHCGFGFDPAKPPQELLAGLRASLPVGSRHGALHSVQVMSTMQSLIAVTAPRPTRGSGTRSPGVAGKFYPAEDAARRQLVEKIAKAPAAQLRHARAIMVPHAGLRYSGSVAAEVWRSVRIPKTLIILSPKHTNAGVNWSVCPFERWRLSSSTGFAGDPEIAAALVEKVPGLVFDVAAHEQEHGIEVQLPLLERYAPEARVVGVAVHGGSWAEIEAAAEGLAEVVRSAAEPPLLVISSDMNHYAPDEENRRLDRLALDALKSANPQQLLDTCRQRHISMCGVIPAALVLATLAKLGPSPAVTEVAYATSADAGGDRHSVVGYAGAIIE